jgi:hypothetical protein
MTTEVIEKQEPNQTLTDLVPRDDLIERINLYLGEEGLNLEKNDYCYIKIVGNHLEIGRAKIILEE